MNDDIPLTTTEQRDALAHVFRGIAHDIRRADPAAFAGATPQAQVDARTAAANAYDFVADSVDAFPPDCVTANVDARTQQAVRVMIEAAGGLSLMASGLALAHQYPGRLDDLPGGLVDKGLAVFATARMINHLRDCHPVPEGHTHP